MAQMKCDVCDEEFGSENELMQHKAQMHAGQTGGGVMPQSDERMGDDSMERDPDDELEGPDLPRAANQ